jgi:hypothetical protein
MPVYQVSSHFKELKCYLSPAFHKYACVLKSLPTSLYEREERNSPFDKGDN